MLCSYNYFPPRPSKPCVSKFDKQDITILSNKTHISLLYLFWSTKSNVFLTSLTFTIVTKGESSSYALVGTKCQMLATCHYTAKHVSCLSSLVWWILNTCLRLAAHSLAKNFTLTNHHQVNKSIVFLPPIRFLETFTLMPGCLLSFLLVHCHQSPTNLSWPYFL